MAKILIVEDDKLLSELMRQFLAREGHEIEVAADGGIAQAHLDAYEYDLVVLDWELPISSGIEILRELRANRTSTPVIMLTRKSAIEDKENGFVSGADDYLPKPFEMRELSLRISALLRRPAQFAGNLLRCGNFSLDPAARTFTKDDEEIKLLPREFALLEFLMRHPGEVFSAQALLRHVWTADSDASEEAVSICIRRLRRKIDSAGAPSSIRTLHGQGYKLDCN